MKNVNFNRISYFVAVVDAGTITGAAKALNISKAVVSKQILTLEEELGTALLHRNTRHMHPTDAGLRFYEQAKAALNQAEEAYAEVQSGKAIPEGHFRITAPVDYGTLHLAPLLAKFVQGNAGVTIDLHLSDDRLDPVEHHFDLGFRVGWPSDSSNQMRKVGTFEEWVVASPGLAQSVTEPNHLTGQSFVTNAALKNATTWQFSKGSEVQDITVTSSFKLNASPAISRAIAAGACFSVLPDFLVYDDIAAGRLVRLLPEWSLRAGGIYAMTPPTKHKPLAIRAIIEVIASYHQVGMRQTSG
ncbi:DNA-binding transcriptional regulator, LysR family [Ruegeria halocynthiae]|uniref:DNA-binding transcriptional regulator, LysR family n=1 Tax=Ruegeria halocynthiae TaxID=985054 RepID=A0A1H3FLB7_9RHOB|nr:DNA-binding transcriptional regulator, LysR family [Ruegeria halocynthiae]